MAAKPQKAPSPQSPRQILEAYVAKGVDQGLDKLEIQQGAIFTFMSDVAMVTYAFECAVDWAFANNASLSRKEATRQVMRELNAGGTKGVFPKSGYKTFLRYVENIGGKLIPIIDMPRPMLAIVIARNDEMIAGMTKHRNIEQDLYDGLPNDKVTPRKHYTAEEIAAIIMRYEEA